MIPTPERPPFDLDSLLDRSITGMAVFDRAGRRLYANEAGRSLLAQLGERRIATLSRHPAGEERSMLLHTLHGEPGRRVEVRVHPASTADGPTLVELRDTTSSRRELEQARRALMRARAQADTDPLTGLANRRLADRRLAHERRRYPGEGGHVTVLLVDCDAFKEVNRRAGHAGGDRVLCAIAGRLAAHTRPGDLVARIGGDEFLVVLPDTPEDVGHELAARLRAAVAARPVELLDAPYRIDVDVSIAVATLAIDEASVENALRRSRGRLAAQKAGTAPKPDIARLRPPARGRWPWSRGA